ncbi:hypothetical protein QWI17_16475 [Gilvimarinus sp. SDUM040013]|uniref:Uncharacterized protein n=1 Tax=Gilvimarinus gilvus TaxID=3058038 RepID=A0ABU4RYG3_9GAMM|nr:hypothetical protein [Gilvimarinus sp. SDUM040013]MDO3387439.1 hypothetical protein [Gilvimarinus sp. SDUM040013]MDX6849916.1 hypothetical protein [Gilvimarinus sp. SDUM040013]
MKMEYKKAPLFSSILVSAVVALSGCGGSGDASSGNAQSSSSVVASSSSSVSSSSSSQAQAQAPLVAAGEDVNVSAGDTVTLIAEVSDDGEITSQYWRQLSGPRVPVEPVDTASVEFTAPATGGAETATLQFEYVAIDDETLTTRDTVLVTVARVNQPPVVELGRFRSVQNEAEITLSANIYDPDGDVQDILWQQLDGPSVSLENAASAKPTFLVPDSETEQRFRFRVSATDNEGASESDSITVIVTTAQAPKVTLDFPPAIGVYEQGDVDVVGSVTASGSAQIDSVMVEGGVETVSVPVSDSGEFRVPDVLLPTEIDSALLTVTAVDSEGRSGYAQTELYRNSSASVGSGARWVQSTAMVLAPNQQEVWVLSDGEVESDIALMSIDLATGARSYAVTDFAEAEQGPSLEQFSDMVYDPKNHEFYLSGWSEVTVQEQEQELVRNEGGVITVDAATGARRDEVVAIAEEGFVEPRGLLLHNEHLYIADFGAGQVLVTQSDTMEAGVLADHMTVAEPVTAPVQLSWSESLNELLIMETSASAVDALALDTSEGIATSRMLSEGSSVSFGPMPRESALGFVVNQAADTGYILTEVDNGIIAIDLLTGQRDILLSNVDPREGASADMAYSAERNLLYVVGGENYYQQLLVVEPVSGDRVVLSRSQF